ncbi:MAG: nucleoside hydrolase [Acidimicrobiia bacterium]|nr:nucleoside hydrolase [Acidimicrobiia bacterium]MDH5422799.1 nucleoside hydrolase [Acidimicrobiia bacterium]MDH5505398.1 nucleoside hydrolase [Acidimicrobiia bacterium]
MLIDTDTASDDAVALVMALRDPGVVIEAITVVAGNVPLDQAVQNALYTVELCESPVPVYTGLAGPMLRDLESAENVHGSDGMGDIGLDLSGRIPATGRAVDVLVEHFLADPGVVDLVTIGPLTNVAAALLRAPEMASAVRHCYIMGGTGAGTGNVTPLGEFNFWCDPEAAKLVLRSGMDMTMIGWDISVASATFDSDQAAGLRSIGTPFAEFSVDIQAVLTEFALNETKLPGFDLPDPIAMAVAIDPSLATSVARHVEIEIGDGHARGHDIVDWLGVTGKAPNVNVVTHVDREAFLSMLIQRLS